MKKSAIATGLAIFISGYCSADSYQAEVTPTYAVGEIEVLGLDIDTDLLTIGGEYYFNGVSDSKGPLAEAAFLDRASSIRAAYVTGEFDGPGSDLDVDGYTLGGRFVDRASGWIFSADIGEIDIDGVGDTDTRDLSVGKYIAENTAVSFTYSSVDEGNSDSDAYAVDIKHLAALSGGAHISLSGVLAVGDVDQADDPLIYGGSFTYYPVRNVGFGASATFTDSDDSEERDYSVFGSWFPSESLAVTVSYDLTDDDKIDVETDVFSFGASFRF